MEFTSPTDATRAAGLAACRTLLRPIASLLLKCGLTWREFAEVSKGVFVAVAGSEYGLRGRPTNLSRVAILTGIHRKEVARLRDLEASAGPPAPAKTTDATRVLSGWHQDPEFLAADGRPRVLPETGPAGSFEALCRRYGGDVPPGAMGKELKRVGAVTEDAGGLRAVRRFYMPVPFDPQWLQNAGTMIRDLGASISHNLSLPAGEPTRFVGRAANDSIDPESLPAFRDFLEAEGQAFLNRVDAWLSEHAATVSDHDTTTRAQPAIRLGVGVFSIIGD
jgi:hypothetical protein